MFENRPRKVGASGDIGGDARIGRHGATPVAAPD
jgi:hypothetical protein